MGTSTHVLDLLLGGLAAYEGFPTGVRLFWTALTVLDPVAVVLLVLRRRAGIVVAIAVMIADVTVNWTVFATVGGLSLYGVLSQSAFAAVILLTARPLWSWFAPSARVRVG